MIAVLKEWWRAHRETPVAKVVARNVEVTESLIVDLERFEQTLVRYDERTQVRKNAGP